MPSFKVAKITYKGELTIENLKTPEILKAAQIYARDLFLLNVTSRQERRRKRPIQMNSAVILPRKDLILVSLGNVRAVVGLNELYLMDAHQPVVQEFAQDVRDIFREESENPDADPPELLFLDEVLRDTVDAFSRRLRLYEPIVDNFLSKVAHELYSDTGVHQLVPLKDSLQSFEIQVKQSVDCLADLLNDDETMLDMLLKEQAAAKISGSVVDFKRHEHVEVLLGVYARQLSSMRWEIQYLLGRLESKREFVSLALASYRNRLVRMNVHLGIFTMALAVGTTISGFFGMNLVSGLEEAKFAFPIVIAAASCSGAFFALFAVNYMSGSTMRKRAEQRLQEIETLNSALSDMSALDYTLKTSVGKDVAVTKADFRRRLRKARQSQYISDNEVDLLFEVFDKVKDGLLTLEDFSSDKASRWDRDRDKELKDPPIDGPV